MTVPSMLDKFSDPEEVEFEEEWLCIMNTKGEYRLGKKQAWILLEEIAHGNRGIVPFSTFVISIPYISEFYRVKRFKKDQLQLPKRATEKQYAPIPDEKWKIIREELLKKIQ